MGENFREFRGFPREFYPRIYTCTVKASVIRTFVMERKCPDYGGSTVHVFADKTRAESREIRESFHPRKFPAIAVAS